MYDTRSKPTWKQWNLGDNEASKSDSTDFNKCTALLGVLIVGEAVHVPGQRVYGKSAFCSLFYFILFYFLGLHPRHMEVSRLGAKLEF